MDGTNLLKDFPQGFLDNSLKAYTIPVLWEGSVSFPSEPVQGKAM